MVDLQVVVGGSDPIGMPSNNGVVPVLWETNCLGVDL